MCSSIDRKPIPRSEHFSTRGAVHSRHEMFFNHLREIYKMEVLLCEAMPALISSCHNDKLRDLILIHANNNYDQVAEITAIFERHGEPRGDNKPTAFEHLIKGGVESFQEFAFPASRDLQIVSQCLRIEYHEMAAYEFSSLLAGRLGFMRVPRTLRELLAAEREMAAALMLMEPHLSGGAE